jgi:S1-C subfamily serine protease
MTEPSKPDADELSPPEADSHPDAAEAPVPDSSGAEAEAVHANDGGLAEEETSAGQPLESAQDAPSTQVASAFQDSLPHPESPSQAVREDAAARQLRDSKGVSPAWKTACLIAMAGCLFSAGLLIGEKLAKPQAANPDLTRDIEPGSKSEVKSAAVSGVPSAIADVVAAAAPSVVTIELTPIRPHNPDQNGLLGKVFPNGNQIPNFAPNTESEAPEMGLAPPPRKSLGTGVILRQDGYILTSAHVLHRHATIKVALDDGRTLDAELVGRDVFSDLAVLKISASDLPVARFGTTKDLRPGDWAIAIGSPLGFEHTVTLGIISAVGRSISDEAFHNRVDLIQTDAAINMGNSGGPLLNIQGEVIGINTAIRGDAQNISFAIPVDEARKVALELIEHGEIPRPYLGIFMQDLNPDVPHPGIPESVRGVVIAQVLAAGPSDKAGLGRGDVIQKVDGTPVNSVGEVRRITRDKKPGDEFEVELWRHGTTQTRKVVIGKYPSNLSTGFNR